MTFQLTGSSGESCGSTLRSFLLLQHGYITFIDVDKRDPRAAIKKSMPSSAKLILKKSRLLLCLSWSLLLLSTATLSAAEVPVSDLNAHTENRRELVTYLSRTTPDYKIRYTAQSARIRILRGRIEAREAVGQSTSCSHQILVELSWLVSSVMNLDRIEKRLNDLEWVLDHPEEETKAEQQDPADGSWGRCHEEWFFKVNATYDHLSSPSNTAEIPHYPLQVLDRVNSPEKLQAYFKSLAISDLAGSGVNHRKELNESLANLMRLILRHQPAYYHWDPKLQSTLMELILHQLRNPQTGWWGESYLRNGNVEFVDDLSITFHVISYLQGNVPNLSNVIDHLIAVKDLNYPIGWLEENQYSNHNNMDVVNLFRLGWPYMNETQKKTATTEIHKMLDWCLRDSLQPDGHFTPDIGSSDSAEESNSWGVSFLNRIGFFDPAKRFWTKEEFPQAEEIRKKLISYIEKHKSSGGAGGTYYEDNLKELERVTPVK